MLALLMEVAFLPWWLWVAFVTFIRTDRGTVAQRRCVDDGFRTDVTSADGVRATFPSLAIC